MPSRRVICLSPYPADGPSVRHRILLYAPLWRAAGFELEVLAFMTRRFYRIRRDFGRLRGIEKAAWFVLCTLRLALRLARLPWCDVVIIHREAFPLGPPLFERLAAWLNPALVFDMDDALWHRPSNAVNQRALLWDDRRVAKIIAASRHVVVGNFYLSGYAARFNARVTVIPTPFDDLLGAGAPARAGQPVVVWIGNTGNAWYLADVLPALARVAVRAPFTLRLIGGEDIDALDAPGLAIERRRWSADEERRLPEADIGIMPIPDRDYERGKSGFKIIQYWAAGLAAMAAPVGVNAELIEHGVSGLLAATPAEWEAGLARLVSDAPYRAGLAAGGRARFRAGFTREVNAARWRDVLVAVAGGAG